MRTILWCFVLTIATAEAEDNNEAEWSYSSDAGYGPSQWALIAFDDVTNECDGSSQSPIQIAETTHCSAYADYKPSSDCLTDNMEFSITAQNVKATVIDPSRCSVSGLTDDSDEEWNLASVHAHLGWEHRTGNAVRCCFQPQSEIHFVHQSSIDGSLMVVAVWLEAPETGSQRDNDVFGHFLQEWTSISQNYAECQDDDNNADDDNGEERKLEEEAAYNVYDLLPEYSDFYAYNGSLTTPPCTEGVQWRVMDEIVRISLDQYLTLQELVTGYRDADTCERMSVADLAWNRTTRPVMSLNERVVRHMCPVSVRRRLISFWLLGMTTVGASAAALLWRHRKVIGDGNQQPLILSDTVTELSEATSFS